MGGVTGRNCDDRVALREMKGELQGKIFADFLKQGLKLVTWIKRTIKNLSLLAIDKILLRKRSIVETVFGVFKLHLYPCNNAHNSTASS